MSFSGSENYGNRRVGNKNWIFFSGMIVLLSLLFSFDASAQYTKIKVWSQKSNRDVEVTIYLPPGYSSTTQRYPEVYNLHGMGGSPDVQWKRMGTTIKNAVEVNRTVKPMIYVWTTSFTDMGDFRDVPSQNLYPSTLLLKELIPYIDKNYRTLASRESRGIDGFSMGGFGALHNGCKEIPNQFCCVATYGAALDLKRPGDHPKELINKDPSYFRDKFKILMVYGTQDTSYGPGSVEFSNFLNNLNIKHDLIALNIGHDTMVMYQQVGEQNMKWMQSIFKMDSTEPLPPRAGLLSLCGSWFDCIRKTP